MTTAAFGEFYFQSALSLLQTEKIVVTAENRRFFQAALRFPKRQNVKGLKLGENISVRSPEGEKLIQALKEKGDGFLITLRKYVGSQGEMSEQFDRRAGVPASAPDLTWSYAGFLSAVAARENLLIGIGRKSRQLK